MPHPPTYALYYGKARTPFRIIPDATYAGMWRIRRPDGSLTDMVNLTRAKDAGCLLARQHDPSLTRMDLFRWKGIESAQGTPPVAPNEKPDPDQGAAVAAQTGRHPQ